MSKRKARPRPANATPTANVIPAPDLPVERPRSAAHFGLNLVGLAAGLITVLAMLHWFGPERGGKASAAQQDMRITGNRS